ncbi:aryl-sulfate sulfotransferase [Psychroserpens luteolus]|uniref:aryl-sulfate sulfotransferase n=1 Tax=Psychroserpens luteolus TaxID=2855840 RepID=UPI001E53E163|nr:aryl-sulfate sulfotransferase [Psychroserpens luteolus]MCD2260499.1 aryl-sulfate sulfotransferase [Psychroserpens luteolus]
MIRKLLVSLTLLLYFNSSSQNTLGTTFITDDVFEAFTLFTVNTKSYVLNNCGEVINEWTSAYLPGNAVYLLPNGNLLRAGRLVDGSSDISLGGQGGIVELFNWDGDLLWSYVYSSNTFRQHHDIFPMPNGNVLILAVKTITDTEAVDEGRNPALLTDPRLYMEEIFEVEPVGTNQGTVVWAWNIKDHLIQDFDSTKANFGTVADNPGKMDINFLNGGTGAENWLHFNSIQYYENFDQIVISSRNLSEVLVIDHSTTTAEAATSSGGNSGKGGDFLYRWGNPQAYGQGTEADRILYGQHYPHYIADGLTDAGKIILFNNGNGREPNFSEVLIIDPPVSNTGDYSYTPGTAYGPLTADYTYSDLPADPMEDSDFYSAITSSAQRLPNGNTMICEGRTGEFFEIDPSDNIVWEYQNPISNADGTSYIQGEEPPVNGLVFRAIKYAPDYPAFFGRDLTPGAPLEQNPDLTACLNLSVDDFEISEVSVYPNPTSDYINITSTSDIDKIELYSVLGKKVHEVKQTNSLDLSNFDSGVYFVQLYSGNASISKKIIKQ